jgi:predicted esterase
MSAPFISPRQVGALVLALAIPVLAARGEVVILKDGYTLHGIRIFKEKDTIIDEKAGIAIPVIKANGVTAIDDGARYVIFPDTMKQVVDVSESNKFKDLIAYTPTHVQHYMGTKPFPQNAGNEWTTVQPWDFEKWQRVLRVNTIDNKGMHTVEQHVAVIGPHYTRIGSKDWKYNRYFLTKEFPSDMLRQFFATHPDLGEKDGKADPAKREKLIRFWIQADWLDEADKDLAKLLTDLPDEKKLHAQLKSEVNALRAEQLMVEVERARESGRHQWAMKTLATFAANDDVPKSVAAKVVGLKAEYTTLFANFTRTKGYLATLPKEVPAGNQFLLDAATAVANELHPDTLGRVEMFTTLADRAAADVKAGKKPAHTPTELLSAAVTGWHLGKVSAEPKLDLAYRCWTAREMAMKYFREPNPLAREKILTEYLGTPQALKYDELEKLVSLLPPPDAPAMLPTGIAATSVPPAPELPQGLSYLLRLPDEYQPGRSYPLLILLHDGNGAGAATGSPKDGENEPPAKLLERFGDLPSRLGYIVAVPEWLPAGERSYKYEPADREKILSFVRHLKRTYQVDSDRVALWGNGQGGALALDLGMTNPDLWSAIIPVNPPIYQPPYIACEGWVNFHQLPVYLIMGDRGRASIDGVKALNERWMGGQRGFPALVVSYKGRGAEWFSQELPYAFDWLGRKRRAEPGKTLGPTGIQRVSGPGFMSVRAGPNRFHWLSTEDLAPARVLRPVVGAQQRSDSGPARFYGQIVEGNLLKLKLVGMPKATVWFGKGMVDYTKPVSIEVNGGKIAKHTVTPTPAVLMEDLYARGDRQRPYFAKVELKVP